MAARIPNNIYRDNLIILEQQEQIQQMQQQIQLILNEIQRQKNIIQEQHYGIGGTRRGRKTRKYRCSIKRRNRKH
jgi:hypothetical protein